MSMWTRNRTYAMWFDVAPYSNNCGDQFTSASIAQHIIPLIPFEVARVPTHHPRSLREQLWGARASLALIGGSNILSSHMERQRLLQLARLELLFLKRRLLLCGVGWWSYEGPPCRWSQNWFARMLRPDAVHSVRDEYTAEKLRSLGFETVNTGCPTTWSLPDELCPDYDSRGAVITVTDYARSLQQDLSWLRTVRARYTNVVCVAQGPDDLNYIEGPARALGIQCRDGGLSVLREELAKGQDYIGTRLHSGIFAMTLGALESLYPRLLRIPRENIERWKEELVKLLMQCSVT